MYLDGFVETLHLLFKAQPSPEFHGQSCLRGRQFSLELRFVRAVAIFCRRHWPHAATAFAGAARACGCVASCCCPVASQVEAAARARLAAVGGVASSRWAARFSSAACC
ncbi:hypothetical protein KY285_011117 [Solanum tuberosum]|nr:hypothetical protein KY289_011675 [Solanum tuberosum]KAH0735410.1 hypothetical protein KY285_011117 [Solanum tuberosum]